MNNLEHKEQAALIKWADSSGTLAALIYAIPNGGHRHKAVAAKLKKEGVRPGVPDLCLPVARGKFHGLYIELKAGKNVPTQSQLEWLDLLTEQGYMTAVCRGWEAGKATIEAYLAL